MKLMDQKKGIILVFTIVGVVIFWFSMSVDWIVDNFTYQFNFATKERIKSVGEIFQSMNAHYMTWNGRYLAHWLVQLFVAILGKTAFSICNALAYLVFIALIVKLGKGSLSSFMTVLTATLFTLFFTDVVYEPTCQIGYVWMPALSLLYLLLFFRRWTLRPSPLMLVLLFLLSVIAGNSHESINIGIGGALVIYFLLNLKRVTSVQWILAIGFALGGLILCLSPGGINKAGNLDIPFLYSVLTLALGLRMTYVFILVLIYKLCTRQIEFRQFYKENAFLVNAIIILVIFNSLVGVYIGRQFFGVEIFSTILTLRMLKDHTLGWRTLTAATIAIVALYVFKYSEIKKSVRTYAEIAEAIHTSPNDTIYVDIPLFNKYVNPAPTMRYGNRLGAILEDVLRADADSPEIPKRVIKSYPLKFKELQSQEVDNRYLEFNPGEFLLMQDKNNPQKFILHRELTMFGIGVALPPYEVPFDTDDYLNTKQYNIKFIPIIFPFIHNTGIEIVRDPAK